MSDLHAAVNSRIEAKQNYNCAHDDHPDVRYNVGDFILVFNPLRRKVAQRSYSQVIRSIQSCGETVTSQLPRRNARKTTKNFLYNAWKQDA